MLCMYTYIIHTCIYIASYHSAESRALQEALRVLQTVAASPVRPAKSQRIYIYIYIYMYVCMYIYNTDY